MSPEDILNNDDLSDEEYKFIVDTANNEMYQKLFIPLINVVSNITGENFHKLCSHLGISSKECGSISFVDGNKAFTIAIVVVEPNYKDNLIEIRNSLSSELIKCQFTDLIRKIVLLMEVYYACIHRYYSSLFQRLMKRTGNEDIKRIKHDRNSDHFMFNATSSHLSFIVTEIDSKISREIIQNSIGINSNNIDSLP
jgi:hypothetical protein